jgi:putative transposase
MHLIVEADTKAALSRGLQGLKIRMAKRLNAVADRAGRAFTDRYHGNLLKNPTMVRNCICYVLLNSRRHAHQRGLRLTNANLDPLSSARAFDGWSEPARCETNLALPTLANPQSYLLRQGWKKCGRISPSAIPASG